MIADKVRDQVKNLETSKLLVYTDFSYPENDKQAIAKELSNLFKKGILRRVSKGMYYKPSFSRLGEVPLSDNEIIHKCLEISKKNIAYLSGTNVYRSMGFTTQLSKEYVIMNDTKQGFNEIQNIYISFVKSPVLEKINETDIKILQIIDAISDIKNIPACTPSNACTILVSLLKNLTVQEKERLSILVQYYKPMVRSIVGAIFQINGEENLSLIMKKNINSLTFFHIGISEQVLPNKSQWHII